jgi:hypothetical protein
MDRLNTRNIIKRKNFKFNVTITIVLFVNFKEKKLPSICSSIALSAKTVGDI